MDPREISQMAANIARVAQSEGLQATADAILALAAACEEEADLTSQHNQKFPSGAPVGQLLSDYDLASRIH